MCDDPDELADAEGSDPADDEDFFFGLSRELFGSQPPSARSDERDDEDRGPTPGEQVLYALGQLHRLHLAGRLPVPASSFAVEDLVRILGLSAELEFTTQNQHGQHHHFPDEVLYVNPRNPFPWRLLGVWEWAGQQEADAFRADGWD